MSETEIPADAKGKAPEKEPEARCWIEQATLRVEVPLFMANGEYIAYGMLHKAELITDIFFRQMEIQARKEKELRSPILRPVGGS